MYGSRLLIGSFLLKTATYKESAIPAADEGGESVARKHARAANPAEAAGSALHQRHKAIALEDIVCGDFNSGE